MTLTDSPQYGMESMGTTLFNNNSGMLLWYSGLNVVYLVQSQDSMKAFVWLANSTGDIYGHH